MWRLVAWRVAQFPLILAVIYLITFMLAWVAPGDPFVNERTIDPVIIANLREQFHASSPAQFLAFYPYNIIVHGDFGPSMQYREWPVGNIIATALPVSVTLGLCAVTVALVVGVVIGALAAEKRGGLLDWLSLSITLVGISLPSFVTAAALLMLAKVLHLPIGGWGRISDLILPTIALSIAPMAYIVRLMRVAMLDTLGADYVRTARAKGVSHIVVIWKHCVRNSFLPVLSFLGPAAAATLTGSFVVEKVFNIPGLGQHFVNSVLNRDRTLILGVVLVYSVFLLVFNLLVDLAYALIDPRIDITGGGAA